MSEIQNWTKKRQSQQIDDFCAQKVNVIVINPVKGDSQPILRALKKARKQGINDTVDS